MKKFLTSFAIAAICSLSANAQDTVAPVGTPTTAIAQPTTPNAQVKSEILQRKERKNLRDAVGQKKVKAAEVKADTNVDGKESRMEKWKNASPEEKQKMAERREKMANMTPEEREKMMKERGQRKEEGKEARQERYDNASPQDKARMDKHREMMENLSPEKREAAKQEMKRHHQEMQKITGEKMSPAANNQGQ